jgi:hypothetical protein
VCFWIVLLGGIAVAIMAMWSLLYRPQAAAAGTVVPASVSSC